MADHTLLSLILAVLILIVMGTTATALCLLMMLWGLGMKPAWRSESTRQEVTVNEPALDGAGLPILDREGNIVSRQTVSNTRSMIEDDDDTPIPETPDPIRTKSDKRAG